MKNILLVLITISLTFIIGCSKTSRIQMGLGQDGMNSIKNYAMLDRCTKYSKKEKEILALSIEKEVGISYSKYQELIDSGYKFYTSRSRSCRKIGKYETTEVRKLIEESAVQQRKETFASVRADIKALKNAGKGTVLACNTQKKSRFDKNKLRVSFENIAGSDSITLSAVDQYAVNTVRLKLSKYQSQEFITLIKNAEQKARKNSGIGDLKLGFLVQDKKVYSYPLHEGI